MLFTKSLNAGSEVEERKVLVFKTNIEEEQPIHSLKEQLNNHPHILRWNIDWQDIDNVLRIETHLLRVNDIEAIVTNAGYYCEELPD